MRQRAIWVAGVCLLAFALRVGVGGALLSQGESAFVLASDDGDAYDAAARSQAFGTPRVVSSRVAQKWDAAEPAEARWPRGYWLFLAAQYRLFGAAYASTVVLQALLGALGVAAGYALAAQTLRSHVAACIAALGMALSSTGVYLSATLNAEALYIPLLMPALALASSPSLALLACAGVLFGAAELTRPLALPVFAVALVLMRSWRRALWLLAGFALVVAVPHDLGVFTAGGREAALSQGTVASTGVERVLTLFLTGGWPPLGEPLLPPSATLRLIEWLLAMAGALWLIFGRRSPNVWLIFGRRSTSVWLILAAAAAIVVPPLLIGLPLVRYRAPADPMFIILMVAAAQAAWRTRPWRTSSPRLAPALSP